MGRGRMGQREGRLCGRGGCMWRGEGEAGGAGVRRGSLTCSEALAAGTRGPQDPGAGA